MRFYFVALVILAMIANCKADSKKLVCYYDTKGYNEGQSATAISFLEPALQFCTHLIYLTAVINPDTYNLVPLNERFDVTQDHYRKVNELKKRYPGLKIVLAVGQDIDNKDTQSKYLTLLESVDTRAAFVNSAHALVKSYGFDGLDLGWQFPRIKPKKTHSSIGKFFHNIKKKIVGESKKDDKEEEHKEQFTALVRDIKNTFRPDGLLLTLTVLPHVNATAYIDTRKIIQYLDLVIPSAYDFYSPGRYPNEADYPQPLYAPHNRDIDANGDALVRHWIETGAPANKIVLVIPTFGMTWKMTSDSGISGVPPVAVDGPGEAGPYSKTKGILNYPEICNMITNQNNLKGAATHLKKVEDSTQRYARWNSIDVDKRFGSYAFRLPDSNGEGGIWVGYDDPDVAAGKAAYARAKGLAGVAIDDLNSDDSSGSCNGKKFPMLRAAKSTL